MTGHRGKVILVNGPAMVGKTTFITKLIKELPRAKVVNFELFFKQAKTLDEQYELFYDNISSLAKQGEIVVGESIRSYIKRGANVSDLNSHNTLSIVVSPGDRQHRENISQYEMIFGKAAIKARTGHMSISEMWQKVAVWSPLTYLLYDGNNFLEVLEGVKSYVADGTHDHCES